MEFWEYIASIAEKDYASLSLLSKRIEQHLLAQGVQDPIVRGHYGAVILQFILQQAVSQDGESGGAGRYPRHIPGSGSGSMPPRPYRESPPMI